MTTPRHRAWHYDAVSKETADNLAHKATRKRALLDGLHLALAVMNANASGADNPGDYADAFSQSFDDLRAWVDSIQADNTTDEAIRITTVENS